MLRMYIYYPTVSWMHYHNLCWTCRYKKGCNWRLLVWFIIFPKMLWQTSIYPLYISAGTTEK